jgi:predicted alpha/beta-fold hydrolase
VIVPSTFHAPWWARNRHLQTIWQALLRPRPRPATRHERLELPDGDFLDLEWVGPAEGPLVIVLHGLEGSIRSKYAAGQLKAIEDAGMRGVLMHFRGCRGEPNRLRRGYHSGETEDLDALMHVLRERESDTPMAVVGYSLGGNVLLKWLGEKGADAPVATAVAVSVPFRLDVCSDAINRGMARMYQAYLMRKMRASYCRKFSRRDDGPIAPASVQRLKTFRQFDDAVTAPLHGYAGADDYYARASSLAFLKRIKVPALVLHARDDPFMTPDIAPGQDDLSHCVRIELSQHGGHVGFVTGRWPWRPTWWLEDRIIQHLSDSLPGEYLLN